MVYEAVLKGIEDGDPMVLDTFPTSPLSGEWADSFSLRDLADEFEIDTEDYESDAWLGMVAAAYEDGFYSAVSDTIEDACRSYLAGAEGIDLDAFYRTADVAAALTVRGFAGGMARCVYVGDDSEFLVDPDDLTEITEDDFCAGCGQIGCGH